MEDSKDSNIQRPEIRLPQWRLQVMGFRKLTNWSATGVFVPCWRLYWCEEYDKAWLRSCSGLFNLAPDRYVMIAPNTYIEARLESPVRHMWFHFDGGAPYDSLTNWSGEQKIDSYMIENTVQLADKIIKLRNSPGHQLLTWIAEVICRGMRCVPDSLLRDQAVDARVREALRIMRNNLSLSPSLVARRLHVGSTTLNRLCRRNLGQPPGRVIALLRLERARHLLVNTDNNLKTVAYLCGYCDRHHLTRRFRENYGIGPASFRKREQMRDD